MPAEAGIQTVMVPAGVYFVIWIPAFAGMTNIRDGNDKVFYL